MQSPVKIWRNQKHIARLLGKTGSIVTWTVVRVPPGDFSEQAPYPVVLVALTTGERIEAQLVDWAPHDLATGRKVRTVIRRVTRPDSDGVIPYGIKVTPL
jgi:uncharacterized OB-fold protein